MDTRDDRDEMRGWVRRQVRSRTGRLVGIAMGFLVLMPLLLLLFGSVTQWLWNRLMPVIFHLPTIGFLQALGLLFLSWLLFGGWRGYPRPRPWRRHMRERWASMTPEQRAAFRHAMRERWSERWGYEEAAAEPASGPAGGAPPGGGAGGPAT